MSGMEDRAYLTTRYWIPSHLVDERDIDELYTHFQFADHVCKNCRLRFNRPVDACFGCSGFMGETQLYSRRQTADGVFWGVPLAQWRKARELLGLGDIPVTDMRKKIPFAQDLRFTGKLHDGSQPNTIDQERVVDLFWERVIMTRKNFGIIEAAARSGKSYICVDLICELGYRALITCSEVAWLEQFLDAFLEVTNVKSLHQAVVLVSDKASAKKYKNISGLMVVNDLEKVPETACVVLVPYQYFVKDQSRVVKLLHKQFTTLAVDECHKAAADVFGRILLNLDVTFGIGLSATVDRNDGQSPIAKRALGSIAVRVDAIIFPPKFKLIETDVTCTAQNPTTRTTALAKNKTRNKIILQNIFADLRQHENNCLLIPVGRLNHMVTLTRMINEQANFENQVAREACRKAGEIPKDIWPFPLAMSYSGATKDHGLVRAKASKRDIRVVVAYITKVSHGLSVAAWNVVYTGLSPISSGPNFYQLVSRISTPPKAGEQKMQPVVKHFVDATSDSATSFRNLWFSKYNSIESLLEKGKIKIDQETMERCSKIISSPGVYRGSAEKTMRAKPRVNGLSGFRAISRRR